MENFFEESALRSIKNGEEEISVQIAEEINRNRIRGFRAFHLASEGLALLHLLSINIAYLESSQQLDSKEKRQEIEKITTYLNEIEPLFHKTLEKMALYKSLNAKEIVNEIASRISNRGEV